MKTNPNDPASPMVEQFETIQGAQQHKGLSKLEAFTMAAMQGLCNGYFDKGNDIKPAEIGEAAAFIAKATIEALNEQTQ